MKTYLSILLSVLLFPMAAYGQVSGNTMGIPIMAGNFSSGFNYTNSQNTANQFTNNYTGRPTNDVYYKFTLSQKMQVIIRNCGSAVADTYLSLLNASGTLITSNDNYSLLDACGDPRQACIKRVLDAGTYYAVSEGYSQNGVIQTQILGMLIPVGDTREDAIFVNTFDNDFEYSDTRNTANYTNQHTGWASNDIFYRFSLTKKMDVTLTHCGSVLSDTEMYLLDASGNTIVYNDNYSGEGQCSSMYHSYIRRLLEPGTYYVVSEGSNSTNPGVITTNISGVVFNEFNYPDTPNLYSSEPEEVGGVGGAFDVSSTGGATYSIPIKVPQGVGGMQPSLSIVYNSQSGNGIAGWGCNLSGISVITRGPKTIYHDGTAKAMTFSADEAYYLDGKRLIYASGTAGQNGAIYYPESDPFTKVIVHGTYTSSTANTWFEVQFSTGQTYHYGYTTGARQSYTVGNSSRIYAWYLDCVEDPLGNYMDYTYNQWNYYMYPATITYGNNKNESSSLQNTVTFSYETRSNDPQPFVIEGVKGSMGHRLKTITSKTGSSIYRSYELAYTTGDASGTNFSRLRSVTEKNATGEALKPITLTWSYLPAMNNSPITPLVNAPTSYPAVAFSDQEFIAGDFNGDGLTDMVGIAPVKIPTGPNSWTNDTHAYIYWASLNASGNVQFTSGTNYSLGPDFQLADMKEYRAGASVLDFDGDGCNEFMVPHVSINNYWKQIGFYIYGNTIQGNFGYNLLRSSEMPVYATGDFNNDGKGDVVFIEKGHNANKYPGEIIGLKSGTTLYRATFNLTLPSKPDKIFVSDFNGNGLQDLIVIYNGGYTIFWNQGNGITENTFSDIKKTTGTEPAAGTDFITVKMIRPGDFNGDGLMDFLMNISDSNIWAFALNNGNGTFTILQACTLNVHEQSYTEHDDARFDCSVYDFDSDGKSDVVITKTMYDYPNVKQTYTYWMRSTGNALTQVRSATSTREDDALSSRYMVGDFNGDGQAELMNYGYDCYNGNNANGSPVWRLYRNSTYNANSGKVTSVIGDYGSTTNITYASFVNGGIYTKGSGSIYPVVDCAFPLHAVKTVTANNGAANSSLVTNYQYNGLKVHLQGKGMLGITSMTATNTTLGTVSESGVQTWDTTYHIPSVTYTKQTVGGNTAETNITLTITDKGSKKYFAYPSTTTEKDLDGNTVTTTRQFNTTYGYMTEEKAAYNTTNTMYRTVQYGNYILAGKSYRPQLITRIQKHVDDTSPFTQKTQITYNASKGYQTKLIENYDSSLPLTTDYTYDTWGNVKTKKISGSGVTTLTNLYDYDATKRFVTNAYTSPASSVATYTYDTWGNVLTEKDESDASNILTTTYTYDGWGNRTSTLFPDDTKETYHSGWNNSSTKRFFTLTQGTGQPWVKTWYDNRGREVLVESIGPSSINIKKTTTYNGKGLVSGKQVQTGDLTTTENYTYDDRGRILTHTNSAGKHFSYVYGNRSVSTSANSRITIKTYDAWGGVKSVTDPVPSSIAYTYSSVGSPKAITAGGANFSMTYDAGTGKQLTLVDPNAGTTTYTYDAAGRVLTQKDGNNKTTTNTYDGFNRLTTSVTGGVTTNYTYGTSGNAKLRLTKEKTGNNSISYTYDNYGRVQTEIREVENTGTLTFTYSYSNKGQLSGITYPGGFTLSRTYDAYGNLQLVAPGIQATPLWMFVSTTGTVTSARLGSSPIVATQTLNSQGLLTNLKVTKSTNVVTAIHDMNYSFIGATGNLSSRTGMIPQTEIFTYDSADRLTGVSHNGSAVMSISYHPNGNINTKTGLGAYSYDGSKPHAVKTVENTSGIISQNNQTVTYTAFNKVASIAETVGSDNYQLDITYGPDRQRWKSVLKKNSAVVRTIVYAGDYEIVTEGSVTKHLYYISANDGLAAVYVKQSGQADKIYYAYKDHLGSIVKLADIGGNEVFKASYDVWGKRTVTNNTFKFHRGYTGHEHLDEFNLIDMNGRMYDPLLARFLSPDPFVQMPEFSQNFNRYSYAFNNPLSYVDPTGEFAWFIPVIIGAVVGAYAGASIQSGTAAFWNWKPDAWKGAITGAFIGAAAGGMFSAAFAPGGIAGMTSTSSFQATGMLTTAGEATKAWGITSTIVNSASVNIGMNAISGGGWDGAWKAGLVGAATGAWNVTGGFGMVKAFGATNEFAKLAGKLGYQMIGTAGASIGDNWSMGENPFSKITLGVGPVNLTLGKGQRLLRWQNNLGNIITNTLGLGNLAFGGKAKFDWKNLAPVYTGGLMEYMGGAWGPYSVMGPDGFTQESLSHEMHHIWQSRAFGDRFLLHYGLQGISGALLGGNIWDFILRKNYFETQGYGGHWFNP
ncbi:FG-GAP-like repeat-containing protein [Bacteroides sp. UBA939]|uniref:FG-GAP-like repeat-containing protein n=1 Tax=Bacteroides sp. UBA939 TaxID=1946092 RepID=UPI0025B969D7|nr:FG-GAP-like repeat-containing protein [Bacteroides sp. UBA939]